MKKRWIYLFITFILAASVYAYSKDAGLNWLNSNADWSNGDIEDNSFALLALKSNNYNTENGYNILLQRKDANNCYPAGNCNVKDTALAALALKQYNYDITPLLSWIESSLTKASVTNWYIQIKTEKSGNCTLTHNDQVKKAFVNGTEKIIFDNKQLDWIDVENDLKFTINKPIENIKVDCTEVNDPGIIASLLRIIQGTDFYIIQESQSGIANLIINNACYGINPNSNQCDEESSFYASYALKNLNQEIKVVPYLVDKSDINLENAMLYKITNDQKYLDNLVNKQNPLGYWDNEDVYSTSFAVNSLKNSEYIKEFNNATEWLKSKQINSDLVNNGSFGNVRNTAVALYLALTDVSFGSGPGTSSPICGNNLIETGEQCDDGNINNGDGCSSICILESNQTCVFDYQCGSDKNCINGVCQTEACSTDLDCSADKYCDTLTKKCLLKSSIQECGDNFCDTSKEDEISCPLDCKATAERCGDNFCDLATENENTCPIDCKIEKTKGSNILFWISLIIIILILGAGGYFAYLKFFKKESPKKPPYLFEEPKKDAKERYIPRERISKRTDVDESLERELDKSIKEAEKLLRK